ncbi:transcriptional repressor LexA [Guggenheimella bovis]
MMELTKKQQEVYDFILERTKEIGYPPTIREICLGVGCKSTSTIHGHLSKLEEKGYITRDGSKNRAIMFQNEALVEPQIEVASIPVIGRVTAGLPILAVENIEDYFPIPLNQLSSGEHFLLKVQGESMKNAGILDGDLVLVKKQNEARNGDYVVALIDDSATVKTFYKEKDHIRLQPENEAFEPILGTDIEVLGKVQGVMRFL